MGRLGDWEIGRLGDGESTLVRRFPPLREVVNPKGKMGRWGDGEIGRWGDWEMGRLGDGEIKIILTFDLNYF